MPDDGKVCIGAYGCALCSNDSVGAPNDYRKPYAYGYADDYPCLLNAHVDEDDADTSTGATDPLLLYYVNGQNWDKYILVAFDAPAVSGYVYMHEYSPGSGLGIEIYPISAAWTEAVTWNTMPAIGALITTVTTKTDAEWWMFDVGAFNANGYLLKCKTGGSNAGYSLNGRTNDWNMDPVNGLATIRRPFFRAA